MDTVPSQPVKTNAKRRWYHCRPRALMIGLLLGAIPYILVAVLFARGQRVVGTPGYITYRYADRPQYKRDVARPPILTDGYELVLRFSNFDSDSLASANPNALSPIRILDLEGAYLTDDGLRTIKDLDQLVALNLDGTNLTDDGLEKLTGLIRPQWLSVRGTEVTGDGVKRFLQARPNCTIRTEAAPASLQAEE